MADTIQQRKQQFLDSALYTGVIQAAFPSLGWALVLPAGSNQGQPPIICRLKSCGGILGTSIVQAPVAGTLVTYRRETGTDKYYAVAYNPQGTQPQGIIQTNKLTSHQGIPGISNTGFLDNILGEIERTNRGKEHATSVGGQEDQFQGDLYIGERYGGGIFLGRAQLTVKGSPASYISMSALQDKITTVTVQAELDSLSDKQTISTKLNKQLKASGALQGMGGRAWKEKPLVVKNSDKDPVKLQFSSQILPPLFRTQQFSGGAVNGLCQTIVSPLQSNEEASPVVASDMTSYEGSKLHLSVQGHMSIKTPQVSGIVQQPLPTSPAQKEEALTGRKDQARSTLQNLKKVAFSDNGIQKALQLQAVLTQIDARALIKDMLGSAVQELIDEELDPFPAPYSDFMDFPDNQTQVGQFLSDYPFVQTQDPLTKKSTKRYNNHSFITQDPDGSITLKDGWGSQITMSHGNIYISSALDTFIRPGRDLIQIVPRHCNTTANGEIELASKKNIRAGAQQNLILASAINGENGYTVLQNRSTESDINNGMVIRSNGKLTLTSSEDMHIGINDKRTQNKGAAASTGEGSIFIEGQILRLQAQKQLRLTGQQTGIYACGEDQGVGIQLRGQDITIIAPATNINSSLLFLGNFKDTYTIEVGLTEQRTITIAGGSGNTILHVRGTIQSSGDITAKGGLVAGGQIQGKDYRVLSTIAKKEIPGTDAQQLTRFNKQLDRMFRETLQSPPITYAQHLQDWYTDDYICTKEFKFQEGWTAEHMPTMCWQLSVPDGYKLLQSITTFSTGNEEATTYSYPGKQGWEGGCNMLELDPETFKPLYSNNINGAYKTYTEKEN